jgi:3-deoxy-D-manno-octulosonic-acid transferase
MPRFFYTLAILALLPWALLHLLLRARKQPEYLQHWRERFGFYTAHPVPSAPTLWIHAVSVGETRAAQPLVAALQARYPDHQILFTHMTPTGRETSAQIFGNGVTRVYLPYDTPWAMRRFLNHFHPVLGLVMETELWPNLIATCRGAGVPLLLVNARLSEKSARRYARHPKLARTTLEQLTAITAIGPDDARRLQTLGAPHVETVGNMKFDIVPPVRQLELGKVFRTRCSNRPVFLCASTREGEEALILDAWQKVGPDATAFVLAIVPRHPQRFTEVAQLAAARGLKVQRRSDDQPVATDTRVWLGDSMGELFAYYAAADVAFVGASLIDLGSQNLIEPCAVGVPVLIGPSTFNFPDAAQDALASGAALQIGNATELVDQGLTLLANAQTRHAMGEAGRMFAARHRGATQRTLERIGRFIPATR